MSLDSGTIATYLMGFLGAGVAIYFGLKSMKNNSDSKEKRQEIKIESVEDTKVNQRIKSNGKSSSQKITAGHVKDGEINQETDI